jgi:tRNA pseudouridine13 synthase
MMVHALQSEFFNRALHSRLDSGLPLATPLLGDFVAPVDERGAPLLDRIASVSEKNQSRISRNCALGRLVVLGSLPGSMSKKTSGESGKIEAETIATMGLADTDWRVPKIERLTTKGSHRQLVTNFSGFVVDTVPIALGDSLSQRWNEGVQDGDLWHPEGACIRFRFSLAPGSYATTFLREFMRVPLRQL